MLLWEHGIGFSEWSLSSGEWTATVTEVPGETETVLASDVIYALTKKTRPAYWLAAVGLVYGDQKPGGARTWNIQTAEPIESRHIAKHVCEEFLKFLGFIDKNEAIAELT